MWSLGRRSRIARLGKGQIAHSHKTVLAREGQRLIPSLLLRDSSNPVIACVIDGDAPTPLNRETMGYGEDGIAEIVLRPGRGRLSQV